MVTQAGLNIESPGFARDLWQASQQSHSLDPMRGVRKFGPHHVGIAAGCSSACPGLSFPPSRFAAPGSAGEHRHEVRFGARLYFDRSSVGAAIVPI
jgi:hypothetical protein